MRKVLLTSMFLVALGTHGFCDDEEQPRAAKIPFQLLKVLDNEIIPFLLVGDSESASDLLMIILPKANSDVVKSIDKHLVAKGLPAGSSLYTDRVLQRVEAGLVDLRQSPSASELAMLVPELVRRIDEVITTANSHPRVSGSEDLPGDWNEAEEFFWDFHVMKNELASNIRLADFGQQISKKFLKSRRKNRDADIIELAERFPELVEQLAKINKQVVEQEAIYHNSQMHEAIAQLESAADFKTEFVGMNSLVSAQQFFDDFFEAYEPTDFENQELSKDDFEASVKSAIEEAQSNRNELLQKVGLFKKGLHWWFRGRYGAGSLADGLLKTRAANNSPDAMFGLYMPTQRPVPTSPFAQFDSYDASSQPLYQRRHFYTWPIGHQGIVRSSRAVTTTKRKVLARETVTLTRFY